LSDPTIPERERFTHCDICGLRCESEHERIMHVKDYGPKHNDFTIKEKVIDSEGNETWEPIAGGVIQAMPGESYGRVYRV